jgi:hypothetical protein
MHNQLDTKPKRASKSKRKPFPARQLTWCEHDVIGTFLIEHKDKFQDHIVTFGYTEGEAKLMRHHIADKIFHTMFYPTR